MLTTDGSLPQQLGVVWSRLLEADSEGPSFISHAACARSVSSSRTLPWVSLGDEPFSPEGWDGDQAVKAGVNAPQAPVEQGGEGSGIAPGSAMAGFFSARVGRGWSGGRHPTC